jgi:hypothetical protein
MALTDVKVRNAKPGEKQIKLSDGGGRGGIYLQEGRSGPRLSYQALNRIAGIIALIPLALR